MERIASFTVDHNKLVPGLYYSRRDGDVVTFDLRFKKPNTGDLLSNSEMHSVEHLIATLLRNSEDKEAVIYFGPMGCQTGCCPWRELSSCCRRSLPRRRNSRVRCPAKAPSNVEIMSISMWTPARRSVSGTGS